MLSLEKVLRHACYNSITGTPYVLKFGRPSPNVICRRMGFEFLGQKLLADKANKLVDVSVLDSVPVVALYFSAQWCPPCKAFTPVLTAAYNAINQGQKQLEIVFVSADQSEEEFKNYFSGMPWLSMEFNVDAHGDVSDKFEISSIPSLVVLNKDGTVKFSNAKHDVEQKGASVIEEWKH